MRTEWYLKNVVVDYQGTSFDHEKLFGCLNAMESDCSFVAVANTSVSVVISKILDNELLPNVNDLMNILVSDVY